MEQFDEKLIDSLADKLLIGLSKEENQMVVKELEIMKSYMDMINDIPNISDTEIMSFPIEREIDFLDEITPDCSVPVEDLLKNSDQTKGDEIEVVKVVG